MNLPFSGTHFCVMPQICVPKKGIALWSYSSYRYYSSNRHTRIVPQVTGCRSDLTLELEEDRTGSRSVNGMVWMITYYFKPGTGIRRRTLACSWNSYSQASMRFTGDTLNGTTVFLSKSEKWLRPTSDLLLSFEREGQQQLHLS